MKRRSEHKLTRQGVRDLGHGKGARRELPTQLTTTCPHLEFGYDRFDNRRCRDCGEIQEQREAPR